MPGSQSGGMPQEVGYVLQSKIAAFFCEFPFLTLLLAGQEVEIVRVERMDEGLLKWKPYGSWDFIRLWLLDERGAVIARVGHRPNPSIWRRLGWGEQRWETPVQTLADLSAEQRAQIQYAVMYRPDYRLLVVYKTPRGFTLDEWIVEQKRRATAKIQDEIAKIDAGGSEGS